MTAPKLTEAQRRALSAVAYWESQGWIGAPATSLHYAARARLHALGLIECAPDGSRKLTDAGRAELKGQDK